MGGVLQVPIIGWFVQFFFSFFLAIPLYFIWNFLAPIYFSFFLPLVWQNIPFWHMVLLCVLIPAIKSLLLPSFSVSSSSSK